MSRQSLVTAGLVLWLLLFVYSFFSVSGVEPTGDGFTRGLNRVTLFLSWHLAAAVVAIVVIVIGWRLPPGKRRWASRAPLIIHILAIVGLFGTATVIYQKEKREALEARENQQKTEVIR